MPDKFVPLEAVRVRGAGASLDATASPYGFFEDETGALAIVVEGMGAGVGTTAARTTLDAAEQMFRGRKATILDDLAEVWWRGEHGVDPGDKGGRRARPFSALPIADRVELRENVRLLLSRRTPDSIGDVAVLEAEVAGMLAIPERALTRANGAIVRMVEKQPKMRGMGAATVCVIFAAGRASIAHVGDCRASRIRRGVLEALTTEHTVENDYRNLPPAQQTLSDAQLAQLPKDVITRALGMSGTVNVDTRVVELQAGDVFVLANDAFREAFGNDLAAAVRTHGIDAAKRLIEAAQSASRKAQGRPVAVIAEIG